MCDVTEASESAEERQIIRVEPALRKEEQANDLWISAILHGCLEVVAQFRAAFQRCQGRITCSWP